MLWLLREDKIRMSGRQSDDNLEVALRRAKLSFEQEEVGWQKVYEHGDSKI